MKKKLLRLFLNQLIKPLRGYTEVKPMVFAEFLKVLFIYLSRIFTVKAIQKCHTLSNLEMSYPFELINFFNKI